MSIRPSIHPLIPASPWIVCLLSPLTGIHRRAGRGQRGANYNCHGHLGLPGSAVTGWGRWRERGGGCFVAVATTSQPWPWAWVRGERGVAAGTKRKGRWGMKSTKSKRGLQSDQRDVGDRQSTDGDPIHWRPTVRDPAAHAQTNAYTTLVYKPGVLTAFREI